MKWSSYRNPEQMREHTTNVEEELRILKSWIHWPNYMNPEKRYRAIRIVSSAPREIPHGVQNMTDLMVGR